MNDADKKLIDAWRKVAANTYGVKSSPSYFTAERSELANLIAAFDRALAEAGEREADLRLDCEGWERTARTLESDLIDCVSDLAIARTDVPVLVETGKGWCANHSMPERFNWGYCQLGGVTSCDLRPLMYVEAKS